MNHSAETPAISFESKAIPEFRRRPKVKENCNIYVDAQLTVAFVEFCF